MKKFICLGWAFLFCGTIMGNARAAVKAVHFDKPLVLTQTKVPLSVERVKKELIQSKNTWQESIHDDTRICDLTIRIEGRDKAIRNTKLGEHYFGSMDVSCPGKFLASGFKTHFSRVLFLGTRNCVESETMVDSDYCRLAAIALRKESEVTEANGDFISKGKRSREIYRITSHAAKKKFEQERLMPEGLNLNLVDSYEIFALAIGKTGKEFLIESPTELSSFPVGSNVILSADASNQNRDAELRSKIDAQSDSLRAIIREIEGSSQSREAFERRLPDFSREFAKATESLLAIISPVEFFSAEKVLKELESAVVGLAKNFNTVISDRDSFVREYGAKIPEYLSIIEYLNPEKTGFDVNGFLGLAPGARSKSQDSPAMVSGDLSQKFLGKWYWSSDQQYILEILQENGAFKSASIWNFGNQYLREVRRSGHVLIQGDMCLVQWDGDTWLGLKFDPQNPHRPKSFYPVYYFERTKEIDLTRAEKLQNSVRAR